MGILDGIVEWIAEQVMAGLDLVTTSVLGALGCDMAVFLRYFPAAETMYSVFVALAIGIILLNWVWQLFKNFGLGAGVEAEDPVKLSIRSVIFILLTLFSDEIVNIVLTIGGTPYGTIKALRVYQRNVPYLSNTFRPAVIQYLQLRPFPKCPAQLIQVFDHALFSFPRPTGQSCCAVCSPFLPAAYLPKFNSWTIR